MSIELFGDLLLILMILSTPIIFAVANARYVPATEERGNEDGTEEKARR